MPIESLKNSWLQFLSCPWIFIVVQGFFCLIKKRGGNVKYEGKSFAVAGNETEIHIKISLQSWQGENRGNKVVLWTFNGSTEGLFIADKSGQKCWGDYILFSLL